MQGLLDSQWFCIGFALKDMYIFFLMPLLNTKQFDLMVILLIGLDSMDFIGELWELLTHSSNVTMTLLLCHGPEGETLPSLCLDGDVCA